MCSFFTPNEPGSGNGAALPEPIYYIDYQSNMGIPGNLFTRHCNGTRYIGAYVLTHNCLPTSIQPSHQPQSQGPDAIDTIVVGGTTVMPECLFCGWRVLSQGPLFTGGAPHVSQVTIKSLVLSRDVANNSSAWLGAAEGSQTDQILGAKPTALCNNKSDNAYIALRIKQLRVL
jgi:hypothetical protein